MSHQKLFCCATAGSSAWPFGQGLGLSMAESIRFCGFYFFIAEAKPKPRCGDVGTLNSKTSDLDHAAEQAAPADDDDDDDDDSSWVIVSNSAKHRMALKGLCQSKIHESLARARVFDEWQRWSLQRCMALSIQSFSSFHHLAPLNSWSRSGGWRRGRGPVGILAANMSRISLRGSASGGPVSRRMMMTMWMSHLLETETLAESLLIRNNCKPFLRHSLLWTGSHRMVDPRLKTNAGHSCHETHSEPDSSWL